MSGEEREVRESRVVQNDVFLSISDASRVDVQCAMTHRIALSLLTPFSSLLPPCA